MKGIDRGWAAARTPTKFDGDDETAEVGDGERAQGQGHEVLTEQVKKQQKRKRPREDLNRSSMAN